MLILDFVKKKAKRMGFWGALVRTNTGVSSLNFFLICTTLVGISLLAVVPFSILWEVLHNDIVASDLTGWATFIGAVSTLFATAGITKAWSNWSEQKFSGRNCEETNGEDKCDEENDDDDRKQEGDQQQIIFD